MSHNEGEVLRVDGHNMHVVDEYGADGQFMRTASVGPAGSFTILAGSVVVSLFKNGSAEVRDLSGASGPRRYEGIFPYTEPAPVTKIGDSRIAIINRETADIVYFDTGTGSRTAWRLDSPELTSARVFYAAQAAEAVKAQLPPTLGDVVIAAGADQAGNLYCLVSPIDRKRGALIVGCAEPGTITAKTYCALPNLRKGPRHMVPYHLGVVDAELYWVYLNGEVAVYSLSSGSERQTQWS